MRISVQSTGIDGTGNDQLECDLQGLKQWLKPAAFGEGQFRDWERKSLHPQLDYSVVTILHQQLKKMRGKESFRSLYIYTWRVGALGASFWLLWRGKNRGGHLVWSSRSTGVLLVAAKYVAAAATRRPQNPVKTHTHTQNQTISLHKHTLVTEHCLQFYSLIKDRIVNTVQGYRCRKIISDCVVLRGRTWSGSQSWLFLNNCTSLGLIFLLYQSNVSAMTIFHL